MNSSVIVNLMRRIIATLLLVALGVGTAVAESTPRVFLLDAETLTHVRAKGKSAAIATMAKKNADKAMTMGPFSVTNKQQVAPSGDKHDYMSQAPYFWPNPKSANGLPYIRRDGERNPEILKITDRDQLSKMCSTVQALALGYYLTGDETYAKRAELLLRTWFLGRETRMNPNLDYGQNVRGIYPGRSFGIIETVGLTKVVDAIGLLQGSKAWTADDQDGLAKWFTAYASWMQNSENGKKESNAKNNHGTYYDVQLSDYELFIGQPEVAKGILRDAEQKRIASQVMPDGSLPLELARTRALSYSTMDLRGLMALATLGDHVGLDLWHFESKDGRSIRRAFEYLLPYATGEKAWVKQQITPFNSEDFVPAILLAARHYDKSYLQAAEKIGIKNSTELQLLQASIQE
jgi:hypothetical protein